MLVEDDRFIGGDVDPAVGLHLLVELARSPAGISQRQQAPPRSFAATDGAEDVEGRGECQVVADDEAVLLDVVVGMEDEAAAFLDRTSGMDARRALEPAAG